MKAAFFQSPKRCCRCRGRGPTAKCPRKLAGLHYQKSKQRPSVVHAMWSWRESHTWRVWRLLPGEGAVKVGTRVGYYETTSSPSAHHIASKHNLVRTCVSSRCRIVELWRVALTVSPRLPFTNPAMVCGMLDFLPANAWHPMEEGSV
eukprot:scaffold269390_cov39-Tisochrysis_lutea.AAC.3